MDSVNPINPINPSTNNSYHSDSPDLNGAINSLVAQIQNSNPDYNAINQAIDQLESGLSGKLNPLQSDFLNRLKSEAQSPYPSPPATQALCEMVVGELSPQVLVVEASAKNPDYNAIQSLLNNIQNYNPLVTNSTPIPTLPQQLFNKIKEEFANAKDAPPFLNDVEQLNSYNNNPPPPFPPF